MQKDSKFFDDMARMMSGAAGTVFDAKRELEQQFAAQIEKFLLKMNFVSREEFEVVRDMARAAREENEALKARIEALEKK
jgi:BMFP domain-containing protein YqiC